MYKRQQKIMTNMRLVINVFLAINLINMLGDIATIITRFKDLVI